MINLDLYLCDESPPTIPPPCVFSPLMEGDAISRNILPDFYFPFLTGLRREQPAITFNSIFLKSLRLRREESAERAKWTGGDQRR